MTNDGDDAEYFLESIDPTGTFDNRLGVWATSRQDEVSEGKLPTLSSIVINSEIFGGPPMPFKIVGSTEHRADAPRRSHPTLCRLLV
jgi:hypothetical protein